MCEIPQHERILILRRRLGLTQREMAKHLNQMGARMPLKSGDRTLTVNSYSRLEIGEWEMPEEMIDRIIGPKVRVRPHEFYYIRRRREGMTIAELAGLMGVTMWWIMQMEGGKAKTVSLEAFWQRYASMIEGQKQERP
jgi:transcriptional regulator with XRE-family HTH domain